MLTIRCTLVHQVAITALALAASACSDNSGPAGKVIERVGPAAVSGTLLDTVAAELAVRVTNADGSPVVGERVVWHSIKGGTFTPADGVTDSAGISRRRWILGRGLGTQHATASLSGGSTLVDFTAEADAFRATGLSTGLGAHMCAIVTGGRVYCWGGFAETGGALGNGSTTVSATPVLALLEQPATQVVTTEHGTCALTVGGEVWCWGVELGLGGANALVPVRAPLPATPFKQLTSTYDGVCALSVDGDAWCWGRNYHGRFGNGFYGSNVDPPRPPALVLGGQKWKQIGLGDDRSCAVTTAREIFCWGTNPSDYLGLAVDTSTVLPLPVATTVLADSVDVSGYHQCAVDIASSTTYCWGFDSNLGIEGALPLTRTPAPLAAPPVLTAVHSAFKPTFALGADGRGYWWGPVPLSTGSGPYVPTAFTGSIQITSIGTSQSGPCGVEAGSGVVFCFSYGPRLALDVVKAFPALPQTP